MRLLLIGCTGFIGRELIPQLLESGHQITIVSRKLPQESSPPLDSQELVHIQIDPSNLDNWNNKDLLHALSQANGVINLAGEPIAEKRWTKEHCEKIEESRYSTTEGLVSAMKRLKKPPKVFLSGSAIGFYGTHPNDIFNEESNCGDDFLAKLCERWENLAKRKPSSTRLVIFRIGIVLGSDGGALGKMLPVFRAGFGGPIGSGQQWMSWIHRTDLCQILEKCLIENQWEGVVNAVAPNPSTMNSFSKSLGKVLGRPSLLPVPGPLLKLLLGDGAKVVLEGQKVQSNRLKHFKFKYNQIDDALKAITNSKI